MIKQKHTYLSANISSASRMIRSHIVPYICAFEKRNNMQVTLSFKGKHSRRQLHKSYLNLNKDAVLECHKHPVYYLFGFTF